MKYKSIILIVISIFLILLLAGCSKETEKIKLMEVKDSIQGLEKYEPTSKMTSSFDNKIFYKVESIEWNGNSGIASITVTTPDLEIIINDSIDNAIKSCGMNDYNTLLDQVKSDIQEILDSDNCPMLDQEIEMEAEKQGDDYILINNEAFEKIIQGNIEYIFLNTLTGRE